MPDMNHDPKDRGGAPSGPGFIKSAFSFFSEVLKSIASDDFLRVLWGVEVLLFVILAFMIWFGDITGDQRFNLALIIVASVVITFATSAWRSHAQRTTRPPAPAGSPSSPGSTSEPHSEIVEQARKCLALLTEIQDANGRLLDRGHAGTAPWSKMLADTYSHICQTCHQRRLRHEAADPYFDAICAEPDVDTVCKRKWELGEALDGYRSRLNRVSPPPLDHEDLELLIRRSVTQPDRSPPELQRAVAEAIERARSVL